MLVETSRCDVRQVVPGCRRALCVAVDVHRGIGALDCDTSAEPDGMDRYPDRVGAEGLTELSGAAEDGG
jgi:hypothetical protein